MTEGELPFEKREPTFNVGLDYLKQVSELIKGCSTLIIRNNVTELFYSLQALQVLVTPRLTKDDLKVCSDHTKHCEISFLYFKQNKIVNKYIRDDLINWFKDLNLAIHKAGLMLVDKEEEDFAV